MKKDEPGREIKAARHKKYELYANIKRTKIYSKCGGRCSSYEANNVWLYWSNHNYKLVLIYFQLLFGELQSFYILVPKTLSRFSLP